MSLSLVCFCLSVPRRTREFFTVSPLLFADSEKKGGSKTKAEKLFNTGALHGAGVARKAGLLEKVIENVKIKIPVPLKGGRGRKDPKVTKKHQAAAARKKLQLKLWGKSAGAQRVFRVLPSHQLSLIINSQLLRVCSIYMIFAASFRQTALAFVSFVPTFKSIPSRVTGPSLKFRRLLYDFEILRPSFDDSSSPVANAEYLASSPGEVWDPLSLSLFLFFYFFSTCAGKTELAVRRISRVASREWNCVEFPESGLHRKPAAPIEAVSIAAVADDVAKSDQKEIVL